MSIWGRSAVWPKRAWSIPNIGGVGTGGEHGSFICSHGLLRRHTDCGFGGLLCSARQGPLCTAHQPTSHWQEGLGWCGVHSWGVRYRLGKFYRAHNLHTTPIQTQWQQHWAWGVAHDPRAWQGCLACAVGAPCPSLLIPLGDGEDTIVWV